MTTTEQFLADLKRYHDAIETIIQMYDEMVGHGIDAVALATEARKVDNEIKRYAGQAVLR